MRRLLYIAYYFPPAGGPGVQRTLKFVRYLPPAGWMPSVISVAPERAAWPATDRSMVAEVPSEVAVHRTGSWDPYAVYAALKGRRKSESVSVGFADSEAPGLFEHMARFIRANVFIPDSRVGWVPFVRRKGLELARSVPFDAILTTGPPHSTHLAGAYLKRRLGIPWVADFRDPWSGLSYYDQLPFLPWSRWLDRRLERRVLREADGVVTVSATVAARLQSDATGPVEVITNGYDPCDFKDLAASSGSGFRIVHVGTLSASQNPEAVWRHVAAARTAGEAVSVHLVGRVDVETRRSLEAEGIWAPDTLSGYVEHREAVARMAGADVLLLCLPRTDSASGILTGKLFEYLAAGRPILALGPPESDAAALLKETGAGVMLDYQDEAGIARFLEAAYREWRAGRPREGASRSSLSCFERPELARRLATMLDAVVEGT